MNQTEFLDAEFLQKLENLSLLSRKVFRGLLKGERRSKKKGISIEFADYREYVPGDDLRFLDWNIYGRLGALFIKLFQEEEDLNVHFFLDASCSMDFGNPTKFIYAKKLIAALGYIALGGLDRVSVSAFADDVQESFPLSRGRAAIWKFFDFLSKIPIAADKPTDFYQSCRSYAYRTKGSGIVVVLSDFLDPHGYERALPFFINPHRDVFIVQILSDEEMNPKLTGDIRLIDSEIASDVDLSISSGLLHRYQQILHGYIHQLQTWCFQREILYLLAPTHQPFEDLVLQYFRKIGMLR